MKKFYGVFLSAILLISFVSSTENDYFTITKEDVIVSIPKEFPKPIYQFKNNPITTNGFILGRKLFYDEILSRDGTVSCHTCHQRIAAFAHIDHTLSHGIDAKIGSRNVPALQNLIWRDAFMWDGGINHLEIQAINPITSKIEMDESLTNVIKKLQANDEYKLLFRKAFNDTVITSQRMLKAIAQFTGLMISSNARYDLYIRGKDTFSIKEKKGLSLFRQKCASCHKEPLFTDNSYRNNGIKPDTSINDLGRGKITGLAIDNYTFKVPSLRNIEMTYPYMHDGRFRKLNDVLNHYSNHQHHSAQVDPSIKKIGILSDEEKSELTAFLLTLTDKKFLYDRRFANPNFR